MKQNAMINQWILQLFLKVLQNKTSQKFNPFLSNLAKIQPQLFLALTSFLAHAAKILPSWHQSLCRVVIFCENLSPILVLLCGTQLTFVQQF
jgi:hypothetical protein